MTREETEHRLEIIEAAMKEMAMPSLGVVDVPWAMLRELVAQVRVIADRVSRLEDAGRVRKGT